MQYNWLITMIWREISIETLIYNLYPIIYILPMLSRKEFSLLLARKLHENLGTRMAFTAFPHCLWGECWSITDIDAEAKHLTDYFCDTLFHCVYREAL